MLVGVVLFAFRQEPTGEGWGQQTARIKRSHRLKREAPIKAGDDVVVLEETRFESDSQPQEALKLNPEVIPVSDLDLAEPVVVGRETVIGAGRRRDKAFVP